MIGILRGVESHELALVANACLQAGLSCIEITLNTSEAFSKIALLNERSQGQLNVGAGTVLSAHQVREAVSAGAQFIVAPILDLEVARAARDLGIPYIPGALTPKEVWDAHQAGAAMIKLFPIKVYGASYIPELRGPFGDIPLLACGGVRPDNLLEYLEAGVDAVALGAGTFRREWLSAGNLMALTEALRALIAVVNAFEASRALTAKT